MFPVDIRKILAVLPNRADLARWIVGAAELLTVLTQQLVGPN
jgi:hypothetical protein